MKSVRHSRYHLSGNRPPYLKKLLRAIAEDRGVRRSGRIQKRDVRGIAGRVGRSYKDKGKADDLWRFLLNVGIVFRHSSRCYFDPQRSELVLKVVNREMSERNLPPVTDSAQRFRELYGRRSAATPAPPPEDAVGPAPCANARRESGEQGKGKNETPSVDVDSTGSVGTETPAQTPAETTKEGNNVNQQHHCWVIYLPPGAARETWGYLYCLAQDVGEEQIRIGLPCDGSELTVPEGVECAQDEFAAWIRSFCAAGVLRHVGESGNGHHAYQFTMHPDTIHVVEIDERPHVKVPREYMRVIQAVRNGEISLPLEHASRVRGALCGWLRQNESGIHPVTTATKLIGFNARRTSDMWGILLRDPDSDRMLVCLRGFEAYDFEIGGKLRRIRKNSKKDPSDLPEASKPSEPPAVEEQPEEPSGQQTSAAAAIPTSEELVAMGAGELQALLARLAEFRKNIDTALSAAKQLYKARLREREAQAALEAARREREQIITGLLGNS